MCDRGSIGVWIGFPIGCGAQNLSPIGFSIGCGAQNLSPIGLVLSRNVFFAKPLCKSPVCKRKIFACISHCSNLHSVHI